MPDCPNPGEREARDAPSGGYARENVARRPCPEIQDRDVHGYDVTVAALEPEAEVVHALPAGRHRSDRALSEQ